VENTFSKILHSWIPYAIAGAGIVATIASRGVPVIRAWLGFKKEVLETKKTGLEVNKLAREERQEEALVKPASVEDVYRYDPTYQKIRAYEMTKHRGPAPGKGRPLAFPSWIGPLGCLLLLGIAVGLLLWLRSCLHH